MHRFALAAVVLCSIAVTNLAADEQTDKKEAVIWTPNRNVKDVILNELDQFGEELKTKLGPKILAQKPYIGVDGAFAETLEPTTVEQKIDEMLVSLKKKVGEDNRRFLPQFVGARRVSVASGIDFLEAPVFSPLLGPSVFSSSLSRPNWKSTEKVTFDVVWEQLDGRFKSNRDNNDVDEVYEVQLNATLRLGLALTIENNGKLTVIDHSVSEPIVIGWCMSLVASEGKLMPIVPAKSQDKTDGK